VYLAFAVNLVACLILAGLGIDVVTAIAAVGACMFNVGPGISVAGTSFQYADMPGLAKWVLAVCMIAGRLEFYALFVIFTRTFWKR
jgi:trk system potassium uptake protein TrkH